MERNFTVSLDIQQRGDINEPKRSWFYSPIELLVPTALQNSLPDDFLSSENPQGRLNEDLEERSIDIISKHRP